MRRQWQSKPFVLFMQNNAIRTLRPEPWDGNMKDKITYGEFLSRMWPGSTYLREKGFLWDYPEEGQFVPRIILNNKVGGRGMAPKDTHVLISGACEYFAGYRAKETLQMWFHKNI